MGLSSSVQYCRQRLWFTWAQGFIMTVQVKWGETLNVKDFDLQRLFSKEGVQILHLSGLIAALSPETSNFCLELARAAKRIRNTHIIRSQLQGFLLERQGKRAFRYFQGNSQVFQTYWSGMKRISSSALEFSRS